MTNDQILNLEAGHFIDHYCNGRVINLEVLEVHKTGTCVNEQSGAFGHAYASLSLKYTNSDLKVSTSIHSDEYSQGQGYRTHENGERVSGWELVGQNVSVQFDVTDAVEKLAKMHAATDSDPAPLTTSERIEKAVQTIERNKRS